MTENGALLQKTDPFRRLSREDQHRLAEASSEKHFAKGEVIFYEGQPSDAVWLVKSGRVHLLKVLADGKVSTTCVMTRGEVFCCLPSLDRKPYPADAVAAEPTTVMRIPIQAMHGIMRRSFDFTQDVMCLFCERLRIVERAGCRLYEPAELRLAHTLLVLGKKFSGTIPLTRQEFAEIAGTTHETAIRILSRFKQQGLIQSSRGKTTITNSEGLAAFLNHSPKP
ncbi:MAG: Crp/Fnr family transcriptional regulator [Candidatus Omnitrophica bacterium]|nr:Crp/Fnr family transcriptional regulator [Candidatus Omnitrophota bacterium]